MYVRILGIFCLILIISTGSLADEVENIKPKALGDDIKAYQSPTAKYKFSPEREFAEPLGDMTLRTALSLALYNNPGLRAFSWEVRAREARALQAGLPPNPEISFEVEDFGGTGSVEGFNGTETTILLSQLIPLGGKLSKRKKVASLNTNLAMWDYESRRINVLTETTISFLKVLAAQEEYTLEMEFVDLAERVHSVVSERAREGEISPIQEKMSQVALSGAKIKLEQSRRRLQASKRILSSMWNGGESGFDQVAGDLFSIFPIPSFHSLKALLSENPEIARWSSEIEERRAAIKLEKANAVPDPFISGGYRHISERNDNAFVVGLSIPIPVLNRNQGAIAEAKRRLNKAVEQQQNAETLINKALAEAYESLSVSYDEAMILKDTVLPEAESAYELIFDGYQEGEFPLLNVLVAQKAVFDAKLQYINALLSYHSSVANVERLTATPIKEIQNYLGEGLIDPEGNTESMKDEDKREKINE